jgi:SAM-dependent methyltransferase
MFKSNSQCPLCGHGVYKTVRREPANVGGFTEEQAAFLAPYDASGDVEFRECRACGFCYLDRLPADPKFYEVVYGRVQYDFQVEFDHHGKGNIFRDVRRQMKSHKPSGRLLDIGTWCGTLLESLKDSYEVVGCELDAEAAAYGRSRGLDIRTVPFEEMGSERFDIVTMIDVLEHLPDPRGTIEKVYAMLNPGGLFYTKVPNGWAQVRKENLLRRKCPGAAFGFIHLNHFSRASLGSALEAAGFRVVESGCAKLENHNLRHPAGRKAKMLLDNALSRAAVGTARMLRPLIDICPHLYTIALKP